jgi:uncharacterized phage infection (PIP) family protein YhgE
MNIRLKHLTFVGIAALPLFTACDKESHANAESTPAAKSAPSDLSGKASAAASQAKSNLASGFAEFQKSSSETLASIDEKLGGLKAKAASATDSAKDEISKVVAELDEQRQALGDKLAALKSEAPDKAQAMIDKMKSELSELKKSAEDAVARFR